jgi:hypothetical protein
VPHQEALELTKTSIESKRKRKQSDKKVGDKGLNWWPDNTYRILEVSLKGKPLSPKETLPRFSECTWFLN